MTATQIGVLTGLVSGVTAAAMVCAGLLSVVLFPVAALALLRSHLSTSTDVRSMSPS